MKRVIWGQGQPETVRGYQIEGHVSGAWHSLLDVTGNYQRRRIHKLEAGEPVDKVRVVVESTHGLDHARICEVRVYEADAPVWCRSL